MLHHSLNKNDVTLRVMYMMFFLGSENGVLFSLFTEI